MTTRPEQYAQYHNEAPQDSAELLDAFRAEMPPELRETRSLEHPASRAAAEAVVAGYRNMAEHAPADELLDAIIRDITGIVPDVNNDYARDAAGIIAGRGIAANALARPPAERLHFTAMRASQYRESVKNLDKSVGYESHQLNLLACQHNHVCHLIEGGLINDAGYYAMALAISALAPLSNSLGYGVPQDGMTEEILAILAEHQMLGIIQSALANDLLHYMQCTRDADFCRAKLAELMLRNEGIGTTVRSNPPLPQPSEQEPATAAAMLAMMSDKICQHEGPASLNSIIMQRLSERAANAPESAPRQLAVASALLE